MLLEIGQHGAAVAPEGSILVKAAAVRNQGRLEARDVIYVCAGVYEDVALGWLNSHIGDVHVVAREKLQLSGTVSAPSGSVYLCHQSSSCRETAIIATLRVGCQLVISSRAAQLRFQPALGDRTEWLLPSKVVLEAPEGSVLIAVPLAERPGEESEVV